MRDARHRRGVLLRLTALLAGAAVLAASGPARAQRRPVPPAAHWGATAVVQRLDDSPFGVIERDQRAPGFDQPFRFAGDDTNLYAYVGGDPLNGIDPSGLALDILVDGAALAGCIYAVARDTVFGSCDNLGAHAGRCAITAAAFILPFVSVGALGAVIGRAERAAARGSAAAADDVAAAAGRGVRPPSTPFGRSVESFRSGEGPWRLSTAHAEGATGRAFEAQQASKGVTQHANG